MKKKSWFVVHFRNKTDCNYRDSLFEISGYKLERRDRDAHGGGLATFIKSDIPAHRRKDLESKSLENITYEVILNKSKWSIMCVYRPPKMQDSEVSQDFTNTSVVVPYCYLFLLSVFILWFSFYVSDIFCKF